MWTSAASAAPTVMRIARTAGNRTAFQFTSCFPVVGVRMLLPIRTSYSPRAPQYGCASTSAPVVKITCEPVTAPTLRQLYAKRQDVLALAQRVAPVVSDMIVLVLDE